MLLARCALIITRKMGRKTPVYQSAFAARCLAMLWLLSIPLACKADTKQPSGDCPSLCECNHSVIDCSGKGLTSIPSDLPANIRGELNLRDNKITSVSMEDAKKMAHLHELYLDGNHLSQFPLVGLLTNLEKLSISNNLIKTIPPGTLSELNRLKFLNMSKNQLEAVLSDSFPINSSLSFLDLSFNNLTSIAGFLGTSLPNVTHIKLSHNRIKILSSFTRFPRQTKNYKSLEVLELDHNEISSAKLYFMHFPSLKKLFLSFNKFQTITPGVLVGVASLQELHLDNNLIDAVTNQWFYMKDDLKFLNLSNNRIRGIDSMAFTRTPSLQTIDLSQNELPKLGPKSFAALTKLQHLYLNMNKISFVDVAAFTGLDSLRFMNLSRNSISLGAWELNDAFLPLKTLQILDLSFNDIILVPREAFKGLLQLKSLNLDGNKIMSIINGSFSDLKNLRELQLNAPQLICDCTIRWFIDWVRQRNLLQSVSGSCESPVWLAGKNLFDLGTVDLLCASSVRAMIKPTIIVQPKSRYAAKSSNVTLQCVATSSEPDAIRILWYHNSRQVRDKSIKTSPQELIGDHVYRRMSELTISQVSFEDAGKYRCHVGNKFGTDWSAPANLSVYVYPTFIDRPSDIVVRSGETIQILCSADGIPAPIVRLMRRGESDDFPAVTEKRFWFDGVNHRFGIRDVKVEDSGIYVCHAYSSVGSINLTMELTVQEQPKFIRRMGSKTVISGTTTVFECMASGNPKPKITWYKDGKRLLESNLQNRYTFTEQLLIILETHPLDSGVYSCEVSNALGIARQRAKLMVVSDKSRIRSSTDLPPKLFIGVIIITVVAATLLTSVVWVLLICFCKRKEDRRKRRSMRNCTEQTYEQVSSLGHHSMGLRIQGAGPHGSVRGSCVTSSDCNQPLLTHNGGGSFRDCQVPADSSLVPCGDSNVHAIQRHLLPITEIERPQTDNGVLQLPVRHNFAPGLFLSAAVDERPLERLPLNCRDATFGDDDCVFRRGPSDEDRRNASDQRLVVSEHMNLSDDRSTSSDDKAAGSSANRPSSTAKRKHGRRNHQAKNGRDRESSFSNPYVTSSSGIESGESSSSSETVSSVTSNSGLTQADVIA